jgi:chromosome segregation ATPase
MQFAERAKMVKTKAKSNTKRSYDELEKLFNKLSEEVKVLKAALGGAPISLPSEPSSDTPASSEAPQPQPLISEADLKAVEELKSSYEALKSRSLKEIEELSARLKKAEASQNNIDYLEVHEEMESFHDQLAKDNKLISELSSEKEKEMQDFERKLADISMKTENVSIEIAQAVQELSNNHKEYEELAEQLKVKDSEIFKLSQEAEHLRIKKKGFEKELEILEAKIKDQGAHYPEMYKEIEKIRHQIQESIQKKQEIEENIDKNEAESQEIIGKSLLLQKKEAQHSQELESLSATKENIEKQLTILKTSKKQKKNELLSLKESQKSLLEAQEKSNHVHHHELQQLKHKLASEQKGTDLEAFNELKLKLAEEQAQPLQVEISKLKQEKSQVLFETQQLASDLESLKDQIQKFSQNNSHLKEDLRKNTVSLSRLQKEISDEKTSRARIAKNIKAFEETLAKAIKEALAQAKTEEQIRITDYVQEINVLQNEIDKKERYIEETKKNHQKDMKKFRNDLEEAKETKKNTQEKLEKAKKELKEFEEKLEIEKKTVLKNLNTKNDEIFRIKEIISANEAKIHLGITQIEKLEADVRHKAAERDIERKKTMRQTIVPRKMSVFQAQIPNPDEKKSFHGVQLKKTNNKFLIDAIQESNKNAQFHELYKVAYEFQAIKSLYANIDEPQVDDSMFVPVEEEEKSSSDSDELS